MISIFIVASFVGSYYYYKQPVCGWEGCDEPGYAFPDEERALHFGRCMENMAKEAGENREEKSDEEIMTLLEDSKTVCDCIILRLEDRYSYIEWLEIQRSPGPDFFEAIKEIAAECA